MRIDPISVLNLIYGILAIFSDTKKGRKLLKKVEKHGMSTLRLLTLRQDYRVAVQEKKDLTISVADLEYLEEIRERIF